MPPRSAALTVVAFLVAQAFLIWLERHDSRPPDTDISQRIEVIDGDTVRYGSQTYRLVGFDTPERGYKAHCADERRLADVATQRLHDLIVGGNARLQRVPCACKTGREGTPFCNYGRLCGLLTVAGRDVGQMLVWEGLAHAYVCGATSCPPRRPWCG